MKSRRAFTLIELLVVVAIIALLIAILLPSLGRAREQAKLVKCGANLHAIALALASYNSQNQDLMPSIQPIYLPAWNNGNQLMGWADQLYVDGDFKERTDEKGLGGAMGDGSGVDSNASWHYPTWGYGVMQCPNHSIQFELDSSGKPNDGRYNQGYGLAWCVGSGFYNDVNNGGPFSVRAKDLIPGHIMASEGNGSFGVQGAYPVPAHMGTGTSSPGYKRYGLWERHLRNATYVANYLFADSHVEPSQDYGWAPSPVNFQSTRTWSYGAYQGPIGNPNALSHVWSHGAAER